MNIATFFDADSDFATLVVEAQNCRACTEMKHCTRVLSDANGPLHADVMFIGEAPGRLGAEKTAIPFHGDKAGENFENLISLAGLNRSEIFVTNSILCNPTDENGNNKPPTAASIRNCSRLLQRQIDTINPSFVVTLGAAALAALNLIEEHSLKLSEAVRSQTAWRGRTLVPLYHPGARAMIHRNFTLQTADYYYLGELIRRSSKGTWRKRHRPPPADRSGWQVVRYVLANAGKLSLFQLHKVLYLLDYRFQKQCNRRLTDFFFIRQKDGPYCVELGSRWHRNFDDRLKIRTHRGELILEWEATNFFCEQVTLDAEAAAFIDRQLETLAKASNAYLKTTSYLTAPMKKALRAERAGLVGLNRALFSTRATVS